MHSLVKQTLSTVALAVAFVIVSPSVQGQQPCPKCGRIHSYQQPTYQSRSGAMNVVGLLNRQRAQRGKPPLRMDPQMQAVAERRALTQANRRARGYHTKPLGHRYHEGIGWTSSSRPTAVRACYTYSNFTYVGAAMVQVPGGGSYFACVYR